MTHPLPSLICIGGHRHRPLCRRDQTSDIDISYSDIGTKYVGLNPLIPISEEFQYRHQLPFRYRTKSISDIPISKIDKSFPIDPRKILSPNNFISLDSNPQLCVVNPLSDHCATGTYKYWCRISNIGQKFIPISDIMSFSKHFSPISDVPISGSVRYRWSRISDWVHTYAYMYYSWIGVKSTLIVLMKRTIKYHKRSYILISKTCCKFLMGHPLGKLWLCKFWKHLLFLNKFTMFTYS